MNLVDDEHLNWSALQKRFAQIVTDAGGPEKGSSGVLTIEFAFDGMVTVGLGTYDIDNWPRHTLIGPFVTEEEEALTATARKLNQAEDIVNNQGENFEDEEKQRTLIQSTNKLHNKADNWNQDTIFENDLSAEDDFCPDCHEFHCVCDTLVPSSKAESKKISKIDASNTRDDRCHCSQKQKCTCGKRFSFGLE